MSYSVYNYYNSGDKQAAFNAVKGKWNEPSEAMETGIAYHKEWEAESLKTGKVPAVFNLDIDVLETEQKAKKALEPWLVLSGVADALTKEAVIDYKTTGSTATANEYANTGQLEIYCWLFGKRQGQILMYNHKTGEVSRCVKHISASSISSVIEKVSSVACKIRQELEEKGEQWWRD